MSESPLVLSDRILVSPGGRGASIVALRKTDGSLIWKSQNDEPGYSSALLHPVGSVQQAIVFTAERALGIDVTDGRLLWSYNRVANRTANIATPIARGNRVFLSSDYGTGAALLALSADGNGVKASEVYFSNEMRNHHASSVLVGDYLYGFSCAHPDRDAFRHRQGRLAGPQRGEGVAGVRRSSGSTSSAKTARSGLPTRIPEDIVEQRPLSAERPATCRPGAIPSCPAASSSSATRTPSTPTTSPPSDR